MSLRRAALELAATIVLGFAIGAAAMITFIGHESAFVIAREIFRTLL